MTRRITRERLVEIVELDEEVVVHLVEEGLIEDHPEGFSAHDIERALVARTLVRELDVNWPGVEVILEMREQLRATHRQFAEVLAALRASRRG